MYFVVENHKFCFDKLQNLFIVFFSFLHKTWNFIIIMVQFAIMFIILCEFLIVSKFDEINCNIIFGVFYNVF
jgi:hypothetical protein